MILAKFICYFGVVMCLNMETMNLEMIGDLQCGVEGYLLPDNETI